MNKIYSFFFNFLQLEKEIILLTINFFFLDKYIIEENLMLNGFYEFVKKNLECQKAFKSIDK